MDCAFFGKLLYFLDGLHQLALPRLQVQVLTVDTQSPRVEVHVHLEVATHIPTFDERNEGLVVKIFPLIHRIQYFMRSVFLQVDKSGHLLLLKHDKRMLEIKMCEVGDERDLLFILVNELLDRVEFVSLHFGHPDSIDGKKDSIFLPLLQHLPLDFREGFELQ